MFAAEDEGGGSGVEICGTSVPGMVRLLREEPTEIERYSHATMLLAIIARAEVAEPQAGSKGTGQSRSAGGDWPSSVVEG